MKSNDEFIELAEEASGYINSGDSALSEIALCDYIQRLSQDIYLLVTDRSMMAVALSFYINPSKR